MEHKSEFEDLISLYALGALEEGEVWGFEEHLETGCVVCRKLLRDTESILSLIPFSLGDIPLSTSIHKKVLLQIDAV